MKVTPSTPQPNTGLADAHRRAAAELLSGLLGDEFVLYVKERNFHWNVRGQAFQALHEQFEQMYNERAETIDEVAERIRSLGFFAIGTTGELAGASRLKEAPGSYPDAKAMVKALVEDHEAIIRAIREAMSGDWEATYGDDITTQDLLTQLIVKHEKEAWLLRSFWEG